METENTSPVPPQPKSRPVKAPTAPAAKAPKTRKKRVLTPLEQEAADTAAQANARLKEAKKLGALIAKAQDLSQWGKNALVAAINPPPVAE